ncbi:MAG: hypothetical protein JO251_18175 [Verrucomicrobia bacterium]|nr:hypothetical protein [Verrucomicrobiota bacterium]
MVQALAIMFSIVGRKNEIRPSAAKLPYREAVRDHSPGLLGLGFYDKELALKGRPNAMVFRHGSQGIHFHPFPSVALSGRISMELSQA